MRMLGLNGWRGYARSLDGDDTAQEATKQSAALPKTKANKQDRQPSNPGRANRLVDVRRQLSGNPVYVYDCDINRPNIATRVAHYVPWIKKNFPDIPI